MSQVLQFFEDLPGNIVSALGGFLSTVGGFFANIWHSLTTDVSNFISGIVNFFLGLPGKIGGALGNALSTVIGGIKKAVNSIPVVGGVLSAIGLATGGYVERPTFAAIAEDEPEYVIPKSKWLAGVQPLTTNTNSTSMTGGTTVAISVNGLTASDVVPAIQQQIDNWAGQITRLTHR
jgi:hypothetical protein